MQFHSLIYRELSRDDPRAAQAFLQDYKAFKDRRRSLVVNDFDLVVSYFFTVFSSGDFPHELRCISGNRKYQHLWLEDFYNVIKPSFIKHHRTITLGSKQTTHAFISELGVLLGT